MVGKCAGSVSMETGRLSRKSREHESSTVKVFAEIVRDKCHDTTSRTVTEEKRWLGGTKAIIPTSPFHLESFSVMGLNYKRF